MKISTNSIFAGYECTNMENEALSLWVTEQVGPRIIGLALTGGENIFAQLPGAEIDCPGAGKYKLRGGHRIWQAPENPRITYLPDDEPVHVEETTGGIRFTQPVERQTGIEKSIEVSLPDGSAQVLLQHHLKNCSDTPVELAAWAITQLKPGGAAILPQNSEPADQYGLLPNRQLALWPYTEVNSGYINWGDQFITIQANMDAGALKIGYPNPKGWLGYLRKGVLFVKKAKFDSHQDYFDLGSSSECYCNPHFLELETLSPRTLLRPGETLTHQEIWNVYEQVDILQTEASIQELIEVLGI